MSEEVKVKNPDPPLCPFCKENLSEQLFMCPRCKASHHLECWKQNSGCTVFGCGFKSAPDVAYERLISPVAPVYYSTATTNDYRVVYVPGGWTKAPESKMAKEVKEWPSCRDQVAEAWDKRHNHLEVVDTVRDGTAMVLSTSSKALMVIFLIFGLLYCIAHFGITSLIFILMMMVCMAMIYWIVVTKL